MLFGELKKRDADGRAEVTTHLLHNDVTLPITVLTRWTNQHSETKRNLTRLAMLCFKVIKEKRNLKLKRSCKPTYNLKPTSQRGSKHRWLLDWCLNYYKKRQLLTFPKDASPPKIFTNLPPSSRTIDCLSWSQNVWVLMNALPGISRLI